MKTTSNLGLKKPEGTDIVDIADLNGNMDTLDSVVKTLQDQAAASVPLTQKGAASGVASLDATAKLPAGQLPSSAVQATTADVTYYVRTDGSDSNNGLANTAAGAFKTIGKAIAKLPPVVNHSVVINVASGTYNEDLSLKGLVGKGSVSINGDSVISTSRIVNRIEILNCSLITSVTGFNCSTTTATPVTILSCSGAVVDRVNSTTSQPDPNSGIVVNLAFARIAGCNMSNKGRFITVINGGKVYVENSGGAGNYSGYVADLGGHISYAGTQPSSTIGDLAINGGSVNQNILNPWGDNTQTNRVAGELTRGNNITTQNIAANTATKLLFTASIMNQKSPCDVANSRFIVPERGIYIVSVRVGLNVSPTSSTMQRALLFIALDGNLNTALSDGIIHPGVGGCGYAGTAQLYLEAGAVLEFYVQCSMAATINNGDLYTHASLIRVA
ncbi:hypothetical protein KIH86_21815 [Paenibacillus sp. HN-1]|uniref:hypothetical protein n=1 Tax=Paenibacillus TaxID=44249 RepID=UPI001CA93614|nr:MULTISPECIES: hypothetical protein [Paenibacillus]MBY9079055.1 hypothetical protein [Paenibacillus sp. CGMCC 1.18879]MBY9086833.1 hypothetical protein [Paenibacillus sinensis]